MDEVANMDKIIRLSEETFEVAMSRCLQVYKAGGIVALPSDTLYGVTSLISHSEKLYSLKQRNRQMPLGLFLNNVREVQRWCYQSVENSCLRRLLPGPVTLIFERSPLLPPAFNRGHRTVGIRVPDHHFVRSLITRLGDEPLAQTSANISGQSIGPVSVEDFKILWPKIDLIIDDGIIRQPEIGSIGFGSTIVNLSITGTYSILRDGCARSAIEEKLRDFGLVALSDATVS